MKSSSQVRVPLLPSTLHLVVSLSLFLPLLLLLLFARMDDKTEGARF